MTLLGIYATVVAAAAIFGAVSETTKVVARFFLFRQLKGK